jgi:hypothetical protein
MFKLDNHITNLKQLIGPYWVDYLLPHFTKESSTTFLVAKTQKATTLLSLTN